MKPLHESKRIRAHEFGRLQITDDVTQSAILIPKGAVQWEGCCNVVFVRDAPDRFYPRKVDVERADLTHYRAMKGLQPDDEVVVQGSFLLKTELKKSSIGAGCCGLDAAS
jgi:membrane fusion protein, heavy metal efflux system